MHRPTLAQFFSGRFAMCMNYCPAAGVLLTKVNSADHATVTASASAKRFGW